MPILKILIGDVPKKEFELKPESTFTIGREADCELLLTEAKVSRHHAQIYSQNSIWFVRDLKSGNGTFVNGTRITECAIKNNDTIKIGNTTMAFTETAEPAGAGTPEQKEIEHSTVEIKLSEEDREAIKPVSVGKELTSSRLTTLYQMAKLLSTEKDFNSLLRQMLKMVVETTKSDQGYILFWDKGTDKITARMMFPKEAKDMKISRTIVKRVGQYNRPLLTSDAMLDARLSSSASVVMSDIKSVICVPMIATARGEGVIYLESSQVGWSFLEEDLEFATTIALQMGMAYLSFSAQERAGRTLMNMIKILVTTIETREPQMHGHSERVAHYAVSIGTEMGLSKHELRNIQLAALLHDTGKIMQSVPPGRDKQVMTAEQKAEHTLVVDKMFHQIPDLDEIIHFIKYHHEKVDGSGYPEGLKDDKIPLGARIVAVANILDNLITYGGPGKKGLPIKEALSEINSQTDKEFDNKVVAALMTVYEKGTLFITTTSFFDETGTK